MTALEQAVVAAIATPGGDKLLKVADVADRLQIGKSKVWEFIARGELRSLKIDGARRITEGQLADFIKRQAAG